MRSRICVGLALPLLLTACTISLGSAPTPTASRSTPPPSAGAIGTPQVAGSTRTVITQLGINIHATASTTSKVLGVAGQGAQLDVLDYEAQNGGWYKVQGATVTGWIVSDSALTAQGTFTQYSSDSERFTVLYPDSWTFAQSVNSTVFRPQQGSEQSVVISAAATSSAFGQADLPGYVATFSQQQIVCGYTGQLLEYQRSTSGASPTPLSADVTLLSRYALIRLRFDKTHALQLMFNYDDPSQLQTFTAFYDSISFPYPLCQAPAHTAAPSPSA